MSELSIYLNVLTKTSLQTGECITPFAVHYEKIRNHLRETAINYAKRHSLARKYEHLRKSQIQ